MCQRPNAFNTTAHSDEDRQDLHDATLVGDDIEQDMVLDFLHNLDNPARTQINVNFETQSGMTPLILACILNQHVDRVLAEPTLDINYKNAYDCSALMAACEANQLEVVQKLLAHPAIDLGDLNASFCMACKGGHDSVVDYLLSTYPDIDLNYGMTTEDDQIEHISGLELAIMNGHEKVVLSVLKQCFSTDYAKFNATLHVRASALSKACQVGNVNIAKLILATGNFESIHLSDGMNEACSNGHLPIVQLLVDDYEVDINYGEPLDALDSDDPDMFPLGVTPFYLACQSNHKEIVQYLLTLPCLDPRQLCSALNAAPDMDIVDVLLSHPKLNINDTVGDLPPLTIACVDGHLPKLARLLAVPDIDVNYRHNNDTTAFMIACSKGSVDAVKLFLGHPELDLSAVNQHGADVLSIASDAGHADVVSLLLEHAHFDAKEVRGPRRGVCARANRRGEAARGMPRHERKPRGTRSVFGLPRRPSHDRPISLGNVSARCQRECVDGDSGPRERDMPHRRMRPWPRSSRRCPTRAPLDRVECCPGDAVRAPRPSVFVWSF
ncbi:hypothetical protein, variant [Aphanomyces invadans]|uniref:Uncharacterized protein n=1 Tax=Aphanomyces invadans TaxID=157072 RepID=A0A024TDA5_9STRA|nr:hypothetical protein, variant [Aphanomyces invadans]ETV91322.1 hypothetical protein, variant [Aphanomyces invadans]|eukprot:XP_008880159.1 hypothetical protein, variant [Aphanomyces invadans]